jgi:diguanylate cyclase (GGDEF)-like protein
MVFALCLALSFNRAAVQHEGDLRAAGEQFRLALLADYEMQRLRRVFDVYALGGAPVGDAVDREALRARLQRSVGALQQLAEDGSGRWGDAGLDPPPRLIEDLERLEPALLAFEPGDPARHASLAVSLDDIANRLHRLVSDVEAISPGGAQRATQRHWFYLEEALWLSGMLGSGGVLIVMLLRESRRTRRLLAEAKAAQVRIEHLAHHDPLTDLPNRWLFKDRLDQALRLAHRHHGMVAMHCVDIDFFKSVNDHYGHITGDQLLVAVAGRMQACLRESDTLARLGGDEFAIVQTGLTDGGAAQLAERLLAALREPLVAEGHELKATVSIGIGLYPAHATTAEALHRAADTALYCAKAAGRDRYHLWQPGDDRAGFPVYRSLAG